MRFVGCLGLVLWAAIAAAGDVPVRVTASQLKGFAPLTVRFTVTVDQPNVEGVCIVVAGPLMETSSCQPHDTRQRTLSIRDMPAGEYEVWAVAIEKHTGKGTRSQSVQLEILGRG